MGLTLDNLFMLLWSGLFWMWLWIWFPYIIRDYKNKDWRSFRMSVELEMVFLIFFIACVSQVWLMFIISCGVLAIIVWYAALMEREEQSKILIRPSGLIFIALLLLAFWFSNKPITLYTETISTVYMVDHNF